MVDPFPKVADKALELQTTHAGGASDSESANQPAEAPYQPYAEGSSLNEPPYEPYAKEPALLEPPYEPYKGI